MPTSIGTYSRRRGTAAAWTVDTSRPSQTSSEAAAPLPLSSCAIWTDAEPKGWKILINKPDSPLLEGFPRFLRKIKICSGKSVITTANDPSNHTMDFLTSTTHFFRVSILHRHFFIPLLFFHLFSVEWRSKDEDLTTRPQFTNRVTHRVQLLDNRVVLRLPSLRHGRQIGEELLEHIERLEQFRGQKVQQRPHFLQAVLHRRPRQQQASLTGKLGNAHPPLRFVIFNGLRLVQDQVVPAHPAKTGVVLRGDFIGRDADVERIRLRPSLKDESVWLTILNSDNHPRDWLQMQKQLKKKSILISPYWNIHSLINQSING